MWSFQIVAALAMFHGVVGEDSRELLFPIATTMPLLTTTTPCTTTTRLYTTTTVVPAAKFAVESAVEKKGSVLMQRVSNTPITRELLFPIATTMPLLTTTTPCTTTTRLYTTTTVVPAAKFAVESAVEKKRSALMQRVTNTPITRELLFPIATTMPLLTTTTPCTTTTRLYTTTTVVPAAKFAVESAVEKKGSVLIQRVSNTPITVGLFSLLLASVAVIGMVVRATRFSRRSMRITFTGGTFSDESNVLTAESDIESNQRLLE